MSVRRIAKQLMDESLRDQIRWKAARAYLERLRIDPRYAELDEALRAEIEAFLRENPRPR